MTAKIILARLPVSYDRWRKLGVFKHGAMLEPDYAISVFDRHFQRVRETLPKQPTILELGPGDSLSCAVIAAARGAGRIYLLDAGHFAKVDDVAEYNALAQRLAYLGSPVAGAPFQSVPQMLTALRASYLTEGLKSLDGLSDCSVDFVFSQAVLEHVPRAEFDATIQSTFRILRPGGISSHRVDLQDHLAQSLNSLRFSKKTWESTLFAESGFYTNRLRASQILATFRSEGFEVQAYEPDFWPVLPLPVAKLDPSFALLAEDDLRVKGFDIVARRPGTL